MQALCPMPRVLYAEDNDISRELTVTALAAAGLEVDAVVCGQAACDAFAAAFDEGRPYALLLLDVHMPDMTGFTVARTVRAHPQGASARIVFLTGSVGEDEVEGADTLDVDLTLIKPVTRKKLALLLALLPASS